MQYILDIDKQNNQIKVLVPCSHKGALKQNKVDNFFNVLRSSNWTLEPIERLSLDQMKLIFAACRDYGEYLGYSTEETRELMKSEFIIKKQYTDFSCSPYKQNAASMEVATEFIQFIIEHALEMGKVLYIPEGHGINKVYKSAREVVPDIIRYEIACMRQKMCVVCGKTTEQAVIDLHHTPQLGIDKSLDDGKQTGFMSLCREHHSLAHSMGIKKFEKAYHLEPVWLSDNLIIEFKKIYKNHFKAFKMETAKPCDK